MINDSLRNFQTERQLRKGSDRDNWIAPKISSTKSTGIQASLTRVFITEMSSQTSVTKIVNYRCELLAYALAGARDNDRFLVQLWGADRDKLAGHTLYMVVRGRSWAYFSLVGSTSIVKTGQLARYSTKPLVYMALLHVTYIGVLKICCSSNGDTGKN